MILLIIYTLSHYFARTNKKYAAHDRALALCLALSHGASKPGNMHTHITGSHATHEASDRTTAAASLPCQTRLSHSIRAYGQKLVARCCGDVEPGCHRHTTEEVRLELAVSKGVSTMLRPQPAGMGNTNVSTADVQMHIRDGGDARVCPQERCTKPIERSSALEQCRVAVRSA